MTGGPYDERDRAGQLARYVTACGRLADFLDEQGEAAFSTAVRDRLDSARELLGAGWSRDDLRALGAPVPSPWPSGKGRGFRAVAPDYVDEGERLIGAVNDVALELRATGTAPG